MSIEVMQDIRDIKALESDLLWEVEINASNSQLINQLILPNDINKILEIIIEQLRNVTKSKYCFAGYLDHNSNIIDYVIYFFGDNQQKDIYYREIAIDAHGGIMGKTIKDRKVLLENNAKGTNRSCIFVKNNDIVERYVVAPVYIEKELVGQIGIFNSPNNYNEQVIIFIKRLASIFALAINRYRTDLTIQQTNENLDNQVKKRTKELSDSNKLLKAEIDNRKLIQKQLQESKTKAESANQAKSSFLANMSHELRTPLNHIIGFTDLLLDKDVGELNETQEEYLEDVKQSSTHLLSLINDILDLSKVEAGKLKYSPSQIDIRGLFDSSLTMFREKAFKHKIKLTKSIDSSVPATITLDERSIKQVMYNLLSNAIKFTPDNGTVSVSAEMLESREKSIKSIADANGRYLKVSVSDTGIGINQDNLNRIFGRFEQIDNSLGKSYRGTGLGLSLSLKLIEMHKGQIWVESQGEGKGSTFHFIIPAHKN